MSLKSFEVSNTKKEPSGWILILDVEVNDNDSLLVNLYNANKESEELNTLSSLCNFFWKIITDLHRKNIILGGELNIFFNRMYEARGGNRWTEAILRLCATLLQVFIFLILRFAIFILWPGENRLVKCSNWVFLWNHHLRNSTQQIIWLYFHVQSPKDKSIWFWASNYTTPGTFSTFPRQQRIIHN